ncbi:hypothetical protein ADL12_08040 [Streptomyces regalis]|uniref:Uncharacterized protein n=1 Tax=Streptomyces regalis TaxID=68262 RepID=A0A0X3VF44_9ACTN|nr:hypothetical protein ADL12_08040 [Streptomyces regalis]
MIKGSSGAVMRGGSEPVVWGGGSGHVMRGAVGREPRGPRGGPVGRGCELVCGGGAVMAVL